MTSNLTSINPATNQPIASVPITTKAELIAKVNLAQQAKKSWKMLGIKQRIAILAPLVGKLKNRSEEIVTLTSQEMGKPITDARSDLQFDFDYLHAFFNDGPQYVEDEITVNTGGALHKIIFEPRGVVASIVPWNFPLTNFIWGVLPNLIVGNVVIFKHSEECPLVGKLIEDIMLSLPDLPVGVFTEIYGDGKLGELLAEQAIDMIWFTGSSEVGKKLLVKAAEKQIKAVLEMGGSNPAILFDDIDIDTVLKTIITARFSNGGQVCDAVKRLIVHKNIYKEVVSKLVTLAEQLKVGAPDDPNTQLGPLVSMRQLTLLASQVQASIDAGATLLTGGRRPDNLPGAYYLPTILVNIKPEMRVWREEVFGPVLPVIAFSTDAEAINLANDTIYGLGAVVHSQDVSRARRIASQIDAGSIDINAGNHWRTFNPFGGHKASGVGCEHGKHGFQELCLIKVLAEA